MSGRGAYRYSMTVIASLLFEQLDCVNFEPRPIKKSAWCVSKVDSCVLGRFRLNANIRKHLISDESATLDRELAIARLMGRVSCSLYQRTLPVNVTRVGRDYSLRFGARPMSKLHS